MSENFNSYCSVVRDAARYLFVPMPTLNVQARKKQRTRETRLSLGNHMPRQFEASIETRVALSFPNTIQPFPQRTGDIVQRLLVMAGDISQDSLRHYMQLALTEARKSPPKPTNFCVGACLVAPSEENDDTTLLATGYTLECEGNTHAEQSCFIKLARQYACTEEALGEHLPPRVALFTTMEPCNKRSVGNTACVDRILAMKTRDGRPAIQTVYVGVSEPETFVGVNEGKRKLEDAGIRVVHVPGFEEDILKVATAGHIITNEGDNG